MSASFDRQVTDWLTEGPELGPRESLDRALAATRRTSQRPGWTFLERWLPMQLTMQRVVIPRSVYFLALVALLAVALAVAAIVGAPRELPPPFGPAGNGLVAYDAGGAVYVAESDGGRPRRLEGGLGYDFTPTFSPDGTRIAFWSGKFPSGVQVHLFVADLGGGPARQISGDVFYNGRLDVPISWSADGKTIAYVGMVPSRIVLAATDGSGVRSLRDVTGQNDLPGPPVFSPDGRWLVQRSDAGTEARLLAIRSDGTDEHVVVTGDRNSDVFTSLQWSPDSTRIVYHRGGFVEITDLDGNVARVTGGGDPSWSPDGSLIGFDFEDPPGVGHMGVVRPDGSGRRDLGGAGGCVLTWSPDSRYLFGYTADCFSSRLVRIPIDDPSSAITFDLPGDTAGRASWQRVADER
jgi:Tol biopolymer transport system component